MTLSQALALVQKQKQATSRRSIFLVCGFQPLHLVPFLKAHLAERLSDHALEIETGLYGDLAGNLVKAAASHSEAAVVVIEWGDLDSRLALRSSGGFGPSAQQDIVANCRETLTTLLSKLKELVLRKPVALTMPTLPAPLFGHTTGWQISSCEAELQQLIAAFTVEASRIDGVRIASASRLASLSPIAERLDAKMELAAGFPYSVGHVSALAQQLIHLLYPASPMKGLITDLDETFWSGIVGEIGANRVCWSLSEHAQIHGLYQQQLKQLSEMGVLLAVASKNGPDVVKEALGRSDLYVAGDAFFPVSANWKPKSEAVAEILRAWNIGADSVVFVDDSPMELEEVRNAFPAMTCLQFHTNSPAKVLQLLEQLRDLFGKPALAKDDTLRLASIRANAIFAESAGETPAVEFLERLQGKVTFDARKDRSNKRLLELINKTNQFNLNGVRITEGEWLQHLASPLSVAIGVSYEDKFGPMGVIGVVSGMRTGEQLEVSSWVLSCRAFSRRIEFHVLDHLFRIDGVARIALDYRPTERNPPLQEFLGIVGLSVQEGGKLVLTKEEFLQGQYHLPHQVSQEAEFVAAEH